MVEGSRQEHCSFPAAKSKCKVSRDATPIHLSVPYEAWHGQVLWAPVEVDEPHVAQDALLVVAVECLVLDGGDRPVRKQVRRVQRYRVERWQSLGRLTAGGSS